MPRTPAQWATKFEITPEQAERVEQLARRFTREVIRAMRAGELNEKRDVALLIYSPEVFRNIDELISVGRMMAKMVPADEAIAALMSVVTEVIDRMSRKQAADFWREISEGAAAYVRTSMGGSVH
jgi:hypothetical protein